MKHSLMLVAPGLLFILITGCAPQPAPKPFKATKEAKTIRSHAFKYLVYSQNQDGSYGLQDATRPRAGTTAVVLHAFASSERAYRESDGPFMSRAVEFLLKQQQKDGSFGQPATRVWQTRQAVAALRALQSPAHKKAIDKAQRFLDKTKAPSPPLPTGQLGTILQQKVLPGLTPAKGEANSRDWMVSTLKILKKQQIRGRDTLPDFGSFRGSVPSSLESDPAVATAIGARIADLIKANYKRLTTAAEGK